MTLFGKEKHGVYVIPNMCQPLLFLFFVGFFFFKHNYPFFLRTFSMLKWDPVITHLSDNFLFNARLCAPTLEIILFVSSLFKTQQKKTFNVSIRCLSLSACPSLGWAAIPFAWPCRKFRNDLIFLCNVSSVVSVKGEKPIPKIYFSKRKSSLRCDRIFWAWCRTSTCNERSSVAFFSVFCVIIPTCVCVWLF